MKIPEEVKIGPFTYKVRLVDIGNRERPELIGEVSHETNKEIRLQKALRTRISWSLFSSMNYCTIWMFLCTLASLKSR